MGLHRLNGMLVQPVSSAKTLRVLDLASPGNAIKGYEEMGCSMARFKAIDKSYHPLPSSNLPMTHARGKVPKCLAIEADGSYEHVHLHMPNWGTFNKKRIELAFSEVHRILAKNGVFFFSADDYMFSLPLYFKSMCGGGAYRFLNAAFEGKFKVIYRFSYEYSLQPLITAECCEVAGMFGHAGLSADEKSAQSFFSNFSRYAKEFGLYYAIGMKE